MFTKQNLSGSYFVIGSLLFYENIANVKNKTIMCPNILNTGIWQHYYLESLFTTNRNNHCVKCVQGAPWEFTHYNQPW